MQLSYVLELSKFKLIWIMKNMYAVWKAGVQISLNITKPLTEIGTDLSLVTAYNFKKLQNYHIITGKGSWRSVPKCKLVHGFLSTWWKQVRCQNTMYTWLYIGFKSISRPANFQKKYLPLPSSSNLRIFSVSCITNSTS